MCSAWSKHRFSYSWQGTTSFFHILATLVSLLVPLLSTQFCIGIILEVERTYFFSSSSFQSRARAEPELRIFSSSSLVEPSFQSPNFLSVVNTYDFTYTSAWNASRFILLKGLLKFSRLLLVKKVYFRLASLEKSSAKLFKFRPGLFRALSLFSN